MKDIVLAIRMNVLFIAMTGFLFPLFIWATSQAIFPHQANGSLVFDTSGKLIGSEIIGQPFSAPQYFHPRPSAAGAGYDAANSSGTNLGPTSAKLFSGIKDDPNTTGVDESYSGIADLVDSYRTENGLARDALVPVDAVTRSGSGLDPHISLVNAHIQAKRVASARGLTVATIKQLVNDNTEHRIFGLFGEPRVNVLKINLALDKIRY